MTLQHILCPVDGSEPSAHAVQQAIACARWSGARITALHVRALVHSTSPELLVVVAEQQRQLDQSVRSQFAQASTTGIRVDFVERSGAPAREVLDCAAALHADLIVMGTHGSGGFERLVLGSVTEKVLRRAPCPVLTVPPHGVSTSGLPFKRILCALDFSDCSLAALEWAMATALGTGAALILAHILEWPWREPPPPRFDELPAVEAAALVAYRARRGRDAMARLDALAPEGLQDRCHGRVSHGRPYVEILRLATEERTDLIVLGVHGRSPVDMAVFGSTTNQILRHATCPVLTVRH